MNGQWNYFVKGISYFVKSSFEKMKSFFKKLKGNGSTLQALF